MQEVEPGEYLTSFDTKERSNVKARFLDTLTLVATNIPLDEPPKEKIITCARPQAFHELRL